MFLRYYNKPKENLATVEVKDNRVCQAYRSYNSPLTESDKEFLKKYCKEKNLEYVL